MPRSGLRASGEPPELSLLAPGVSGDCARHSTRMASRLVGRTVGYPCNLVCWSQNKRRAFWRTAFDSLFGTHGWQPA